MDLDAEKHAWEKRRDYTPETLALAEQILADIRTGREVTDAIRLHPLPQGGFLGKSALVAAYHALIERGKWDPDPQLLTQIRLKPIRTLSGVATVTVMTKPYPCPGTCIFCPTEVRMPKSYLIGEPGAMRGLQNNFEPFEQVASRVQSLGSVGHPTDKIELLILGGTWSAYQRDYQEWFVKRCLDALNKRDSASLEEAQNINEISSHRNVGLVIETRPDQINNDEIFWLRKLGVTKVQIGAQSMDDHILKINKRGHTAECTRQAVALLRAAGFKIVLHWMPNLLGASLESDRMDFARLWDGLNPDEIKIYPNQLLENAELYQYWQRGEFQPYTMGELITLIADIKTTIPHYCRVNRIIRDIPSTLVVEGNKRTSLRQDIQLELKRRGDACQCIRCREVRGEQVDAVNLTLDDLVYFTDGSEEHFLSFQTTQDKLAGFLRLSLPGSGSPATGIVDLDKAAIIREVHIYGQSVPVGIEQDGAVQHIGLGTRLLARAEKIASQKGYQHLAVISAVGTRQYYLNRGYKRADLYLVKDLT